MSTKPPSAPSPFISLVVPSTDGFPLAARQYVPAGRPRATVLIHSATATPQRYYTAFATALAVRGFRVVTYDYRGVGESRSGDLRELEATMTDWARRDAVAIHDAVAAFPEPLLLVGHSFGGQLLGLIDPPARARSIVLVGAQLGYYRHWPAPQKYAYGAIWHVVVPAVVAAFGYMPGFMGLGEDLPAGVGLEWARWCRSPGYLRDHHPDAEARFARLAAPILFYSFTDDRFAPKAAVSALVSAFRGAKVIHRRFAPAGLGKKEVGHFGFFRRDVVPALWEETFRFLEDTAAGEAPLLRSRSPSEWNLELEDLEADLAYGRA